MAELTHKQLPERAMANGMREAALTSLASTRAGPKLGNSEIRLSGNAWALRTVSLTKPLLRLTNEHSVLHLTIAGLTLDSRVGR